MHIALWRTKATATHSEYAYLLLFQDNNSNANAPQCCPCTFTAYLAYFQRSGSWTPGSDKESTDSTGRLSVQNRQALICRA